MDPCNVFDNVHFVPLAIKSVALVNLHLHGKRTERSHQEQTVLKDLC